MTDRVMIEFVGLDYKTDKCVSVHITQSSPAHAIPPTDDHARRAEKSQSPYLVSTSQLRLQHLSVSEEKQRNVKGEQRVLVSDRVEKIDAAVKG